MTVFPRIRVANSIDLFNCRKLAVQIFGTDGSRWLGEYAHSETVLVTGVGQEIVGYGRLYDDRGVTREPRAWMEPGAAAILGVLVEPNMQNRGIGAALMSAMVAIATKGGDRPERRILFPARRLPGGAVPVSGLARRFGFTPISEHPSFGMHACPVCGVPCNCSMVIYARGGQ